MNKWEKQREEDIKNGSYMLGNADKIVPNISIKDMKKIISEYRLKEINFKTKADREWTIMMLKADLYLKKFENTFEGIRSWFIHYDLNIQEQFPKLFWEEYVYRETKYRGYDFEDTVQFAGVMSDIKDYIQVKRLEGKTGEQLQEEDWGEEMVETFGLSWSWRSWGALMAAYMNSKEKERKYNYMNFYM